MDTLFSWGVIGWAIPVLLGIAFGVIQMGDFKFAKACFLFSALLAEAKILMWGIGTAYSGGLRVLVCFAASGLIGVLLVESFRYVNRKRDNQPPKHPSPAKHASPVEALNAPKLLGEIQHVYIGVAPVAPNDTAFFLDVTVKNLGMPSIVENYSLSIDIPNKGLLPTKPMLMAKSVTLGRENQAGIKLFGDDALYAKTANAPITKGGMATGLLFFSLEGIPKEQIEGTRVRLILKFYDVTGKEWSTTREMPIERDGGDDPRISPGIKAELIPPKKPRPARRKKRRK